MKNILFLLFFSTTLFAQQVAKIDSGVVKGVNYRIFFPANWHKKLVVFTHGYEFVGSPPQVLQPNFGDRMKPFLDRGFAVAASSYRIQGFSMPQGVDDSEDLRRYIFAKYGKPDTCIMVGQSLGGGVALATMENFAKNYQGALALCPFSSRPYLQCRKEFDMYALVNVFFPNIVPPLSEVMNPQKIYKATGMQEAMAKMQRIRTILAKDSVLAEQFSKRFDLKYKDLPMSLAFNENVLRDIAQKAGGNPFDNTNTVYAGFPNDYELNKKVERLAQNVEEDRIFGKYDRNGNIGKPVVLMHTVYDQLIPPQYGVVNFDNMVHQKNKEQLLTVKYTNGEGHCQFSDEQIGKAFDALRTWLYKGVKPPAGFVE